MSVFTLHLILDKKEKEKKKEREKQTKDKTYIAPNPLNVVLHRAIFCFAHC